MLGTFFTIVCVLAAAAGILLFPSAAAEGARTGLRFCGEILVPSIFPFMVLSAFVVKSGVASRLSTVLQPVTRRLFRLPGCTGATIVIGLIGGYPAGARGIKALIERGDITPAQGERMLSFAVGAGPAFVISVVGTGLLGSGTAGVILFFSQIAAAILIGIFTGHFFQDPRPSAPLHKTETPSDPDFTTALVESSADSTNGMLNMCAFVVLFSAVLNIMRVSGASGWITSALMALGLSESTASSLLSILLEVTSGCTEASRAGASPTLISFALGWSGACVHFQIAASLNGVRFSRMHFTLFRFVHGLLAALLSAAAFHFFPDTAAEVFSNVSQQMQPDFAANPAGSVMLIVVCAVFLFTLSAQKIDFRRKKC